MFSEFAFPRAAGLRKAGGACAAALALCGCATPHAGPSGLYARPIGDAPVTANPTPYSAALVCLAEYAARYHVVPPRIAVGRISDLTGKLEDNGGRMVTQGAALMAMSALGKAGVPLVERYETDVPKLEYKLADNRLITDDREPSPDGQHNYRAVFPGDVTGSDFFLTGGITELNSNIRSPNVGVTAEKSNRPTANVSGSLLVMNVGIDLRLVNTRSLDVVDMISYQKQIIGTQVGAGVYAFFGNNILNVSAGGSADEPIHLAVRSLIERAVVEMMANLYGAPGPQACMAPGQDPLAAQVVTAGLTGAYTPAYDNGALNNASTRAEPRRWLSVPAPQDPAESADDHRRF